jgi:hypothetical protein
MKAVAGFVLLSAIVTSGLLAQTQANSGAIAGGAIPPGAEVRISHDVAEKLLTHKVDPDVCPHIAMAAHVTGTVVVGFGISKNGNVLYPKIISGPALLRRDPSLRRLGNTSTNPI